MTVVPNADGVTSKTRGPNLQKGYVQKIQELLENAKTACEDAQTLE